MAWRSIIGKVRGHAFSFLALVSTSAALAHAEPILEWTPKQVSEEVEQGQTKAVVVRVTSSEDIADLSFSIPEELRQQIAVEPSISELKKGQPTELTLLITGAPSGRPKDVAKGVLRAQSGNQCHSGKGPKGDNGKEWGKDWNGKAKKDRGDCEKWPGGKWKEASRTLPKPLPITIKTKWPTFSDPRLPNVSFEYPTFGQDSFANLTTVNSNVTVVEVFSASSSSSEPLEQASFRLTRNIENLSLDAYFDRLRPSAPILRSSGAFRYEVYPNGVTAYVQRGSIPPLALRDGPSPLIVAMSPMRDYLIIANVSQVSDWGLYVGEGDQVTNTLVSTLRSFEF